MKNVFNLENYKHNIFNDTYKDISIIEQINFALSGFYCTPCHHKKETPDEWNPLFLHFWFGGFDPYRISMCECSTEDLTDLFELRKNMSGLEATKEYLEDIKEIIGKDNHHTDIFRAVSQTSILSNHFIITKEPLTDNSEIIGFFHLETKTFRRYVIKDVKKLCELLRFSSHDFTKIFGYPEKTEVFKHDTSKEEFQKEFLNLVESAQHIEIENEHILEMLACFRDKKSNVQNLFN